MSEFYIILAAQATTMHLSGSQLYALSMERHGLKY